MTELLNTTLMLLAEADAPANPPGEGTGGGGLFQMLIFLLPAIILMFFFMNRTQRKQQNEMQRMYDNLKKNDKVMTAGGIIGTISNVNRDKGIVTLRVDDNSTIQFAMGSITRLITDEDSEKEES